MSHEIYDVNYYKIQKSDFLQFGWENVESHSSLEHAIEKVNSYKRTSLVLWKD